MKNSKRVKVRKLEGTDYLISEDEKISQNSNGCLYVAYSVKNPNLQLLAKIVNIQKTQNIQSIAKEIEGVIKLTDQQNLVKYYQIKILNESSYCLIMDYCNEGPLTHHLSDLKLIPQEKIWIFLYQFCKGYQYLLQAHSVHLGIHPDNILINDGIYKISDFGIFKYNQFPSKIKEITSTKSWLYMAPEVQKGKKEGLTSKADVFSLGCILYQFSYDGNHPYLNQKQQSINIKEYFEKIGKNKVSLNEKNRKGETRSTQLRQLLRRMLQCDSQKRISWQQIFDHNKIKIHRHQKEITDRSISQKQTEILQLRKTLVQVNKSSIIISEVQTSEQNQSKIIAYQQLLDQTQLKYLEKVMIRLKILLLTIFHCNNKINIIIKENGRFKKLQNHIIDSIKKVAIEGLLYLLKNIEIITNKIADYDASLSNEIKLILQNDKIRVIQEYKKMSKTFKHVDEETFIAALKSYDLRSFQHCLYNLLTVYCDYHKEGKDILRVTISILIDIYDTSLRLTEMTQKQKISWRNPYFEQIETKMDEICLNRHEPQQFHNYLASKELISQRELTVSLKSVGLLFQ